MKPSLVRRCLLGMITLSALAISAAPTAHAQTQINRPIRLIVPYVPGGGTDLLARLIGPYIGEEFGQQVVIDNRPGGGSTIGTLAVAKAPPDGLTIGMIGPLSPIRALWQSCPTTRSRTSFLSCCWPPRRW